MSSNESAQSTKPRDALASPFVRPTTVYLLCFGAGSLPAGAGMRVVLRSDASGRTRPTGRLACTKSAWIRPAAYRVVQP
ncbi:uncharacterized protein SCHCODRAFT_02710476, partial [Schizophyllum commune H4-8]|uniref:uncharacterized protein n=1 Tax=Schizophyllum commune (strain H4-8 / FGSC 9210) TaxID=578458 RepID=UPI00215FE5F0